MKSFSLFIKILLLNGLLTGCASESFIKDIYVNPVASFTTTKTEYEVHESVLFTNTGEAQKFVVYPGDSLHKYNVSYNTGYATASNGTFSFAYNEPGTYKAIWVASSINEKGEIITAVDSTQINVVATNGGLDNFLIYNIYKMTDYSSAIFFSSTGVSISKDTILCPILFDAWRPSLAVNSIKAPQLINFRLASSLSKFIWVDNNGLEREIKTANSASRIVNFLKNGSLAVQQFIVKTASGFNSNYYIAPVIIPKMTKFTVNGINGTITRDIAYYNRYNVSISLPTGTDLSSIVPTFEIMNNDVNLVGGNIEVTVNGVMQTSGSSVLNASGKTLIYNVKSYLLGTTNNKLNQESIITVTFL